MQVCVIMKENETPESMFPLDIGKTHHIICYDIGDSHCSVVLHFIHHEQLTQDTVDQFDYFIIRLTDQDKRKEIMDKYLSNFSKTRICFNTLDTLFQNNCMTSYCFESLLKKFLYTFIEVKTNKKPGYESLSHSQFFYKGLLLGCVTSVLGTTLFFHLKLKDRISNLICV